MSALIIAVAVLAAGFVLTVGALVAYILKNRQGDAEARLELAIYKERQRNSEEFFKAQREHAQTSFKNVAETIIQSGREQFSKDSKDAIGGLVAPLKKDLDNLKTQLSHQHGELSKGVDQVVNQAQRLQRETVSMKDALKRPEIKGRWGELQLRNVLEMAGMSAHVDFNEQVSLTDDDDNAKRPDAVIMMPNQGALFIDSKAPLSNYMSAIEADDPQERVGLLQKYAGDVYRHVVMLGSKAYQSSVKTKTPDFVIMFIPGDQFLTSVYEHRESLIEDAFKKRIIICTPGTLLALLKTVAYSWQQVEINRNAEKIAEQGERLHTRVVKYLADVAALNKALNSAVNRFNVSVGSLEARVIPAARALGALLGKTDEIETPLQIDAPPRGVARPADNADADEEDNHL